MNKLMAFTALAIVLAISAPSQVRAMGGQGSGGGHSGGSAMHDGFDGHHGFDGRHDFDRGEHLRFGFGPDFYDGDIGGCATVEQRTFGTEEVLSAAGFQRELADKRLRAAQDNWNAAATWGTGGRVAGVLAPGPQ